MTRNLLLVSNTKVAGGGIFTHARNQIKELFGSRKTITFIPYASPSGMEHKEYVAKLQPTFREMGYELQLPDSSDSAQSIRDAEAIFIGGGNTWRLLKDLKDRGLLYTIREAVNGGTPYLGSSAGSNVAGLTIGNTNDMPAAECYGRDALGLVPFNINPHYQDTVKLSPEEREAVLINAPQLKVLIDHQGETRDDRLKEYHALGNAEAVVALREGSMLKILDDEICLEGGPGAKIFILGRDPIDIRQARSLSDLLM